MTIKKKILLIICFIIVCSIYRLSPYKIDFLGYYNTKIGAHQCNTIHKLKSAKKFFNIIELDLVYKEKEKVFDIYHFPDKSTGLYLDKYLEEVKKIDKELFLWLDIKNLKKENTKLIYERIAFLLAQNEIPIDKVLIETRYPEALNLFIEQGFKASYYLPKLYDISNGSIDSEIIKIKNILNKNPKMAISFDHKNYNIVKKEFPEKRKYIWSLVRFINPYYFKTREILKDKTVKVVLVGFKNI